MVRIVKWLIGLVVIAALGWSGWWYLGATGQEAGIRAWLEKQRDRGWQAEARDIDVSGYPTDFRMVATDIELADPQTGWAWRSPELKADSQASVPTRINVTWPAKHSIAVPEDQVTITSKKMETLLDLRPGPAMELREAASQIEALVLTARSGWKADAKSANLQLLERAADTAPENSYNLKAVAVDVTLPKELVAQIDPTGWLQPKIGTLTFLAHGAFDDPLDRKTVEDGRLALRQATIREAGFEWGDMRLVLKGSFEVDDFGYPVGSIEIEANEWRQMVRLARRSGVIDRNLEANIVQGIELFTALLGGGDDLSAPFGLSDGKIKLGPFAIADAPRLAPPR
ncbi:MAG: DUF2125 domain-containing protein [Pseudomonadota bacterium]